MTKVSGIDPSVTRALHCPPPYSRIFVSSPIQGTYHALSSTTKVSNSDIISLVSHLECLNSIANFDYLIRHKWSVDNIGNFHAKFSHLRSAISVRHSATIEHEYEGAAIKPQSDEILAPFWDWAGLCWVADRAARRSLA